MKSEKEITKESKAILESDQRRVPIEEVDKELEDILKRQHGMKMFEGESVSINMDLSGDQFTDECLEKIAETPIDQLPPITHNFDSSKPIGKVTSIRKEGNKIFVSGIIDKGLEGFIVPGGIRVDTPGINIKEFALTKTSIDQSLNPMRYIDDEGDE